MTLAEENLSILLVEDETEDEALIISILLRNGLKFKHHRVDRADEFLHELTNGLWDLIISDYNLPIFSANEALNILKQQDLDIPCVVVSGYISEEVAASLMKSGASDFIHKDNLSRLVPAIRREVTEARNRLEKRKAEQSLRHHEKLIAGIAKSLGEGLIVSSTQGEIIFCNPEAEHLLGWDENQLVGLQLDQIIFDQPPQENFTLEKQYNVTRFTDQNIPIRSEDEFFVRKDGSVFNISYVSTQIFEDYQVVAVVTAFKDITQRKQAEQELIESRKQFRELSNFLQNVREKERTRIARELHDELGQSLTALKMDVAWIIPRLSSDSDGLKVKVNSMLTLLDTTVDSVRRIAANLRPSLLDDLGLSAAMDWLLNDFQNRTGVVCKLEICHYESDFDPDVNTALFRILQEAITNVTRYAQASHVYVTLEDQGDAIFLKVRDNGIGFDAHKAQSKGKKTFGLLGMKERANTYSGTLEIISQLGGGTELKVRIPKQLAHKPGGNHDKSPIG